MSQIIEINGRYYDFGTKNSSFLLTAQELKTLGIKNWYFMLEVRHPEFGVQDLDPHSSDLTEEEMGRLIVECKHNPWFFFREVALVPVRGAGNLKPILSRASLAAVWCFIHSVDFMLCQPRQTYKSTWCTLILEYMFIYEFQNVEIPMMHIRQDRCLESAEMLRDYICTLPKYMNPWSNRNKLPGTKSLKYEEHNTSITILSQADSAVKAKDKMRGFTVFGAMLEEYEYIPYYTYVMEGATPAIISGRDIARQTGGRTCVMSLSTPGDLETETGRRAQHMIDLTPQFNEQMYDMTEKELDEFFSGMTRVNESGDPQPVTTLYIEFNYKQLRKDEKWLNEQYQEALRLDRLDEYRRGVLLQRYRGSGSVLFEQADIDYIQNHVKEPVHTLFLLKKFNLYVYQHQIYSPDLNSETPYFDTQIPYLIGVDVSAGGNGDNTTIIIVNPYTLEIAAELSSPYIGSLDLMRLIAVIAKLCPRGIFCLETNSIGKSIVDFVQESQLENRFYHDPKLDMAKNAIQHEKSATVLLRQKAEQKYYIGTYVTTTVRNNMFDLLKRYVKEYKHLLNTRYLVKDILNLERGKNGKIAAAEGEHDDMVMAYLHVLYVLHYGAELGRFGIDKRRCTYEKARDVVRDYDKSLKEEKINNVVPYENPNAYENQLLRDLVNQSQDFALQGGRDVYGYKPEQYNAHNTTPEQQHPVAVLSSSDMQFYTNVNSLLGLM